MFIPIRDTVPSSARPVLTYTIIAACVVIFGYQAALSEAGLSRFVDRFGMAPSHLFGAEGDPLLGRMATLITCMFLHGGWLHLLGNMLYLYIFGDNVEDRLGHVGFVFFYLGTGMVGSLCQAVLDPGSTVHTIGASGAIAGVLGAYIVFHPHARVLAIVFIVIIFQAIEVPAYLFLGFWFVLQLFQGVGALGAEAGGGVAWWAHIGGFAVGAGVAWVLRRGFSRTGPPPFRFPHGA
jgi:membrane associated rhomboid family serine protease